MDYSQNRELFFVKIRFSLICCAIMITTSLSGCLVTDDDTIPDDNDALQTLRIKLVSHIWGPNGFPERSPELVLEDINETGFQNLSNLGQIDRLDITSEFGIPSVVYHFHPAVEPVDRLIVYHQGHMGGV